MVYNEKFWNQLILKYLQIPSDEDQIHKPKLLFSQKPPHNLTHISSF